jgi:hypothetical protein
MVNPRRTRASARIGLRQLNTTVTVRNWGTFTSRFFARKSGDFRAAGTWSRVMKNSSRSPRVPAWNRTALSGIVRNTIFANG